MSIEEDILAVLHVERSRPTDWKAAAIFNQLKKSELVSAARRALEIMELEANKPTAYPAHDSMRRDAFYKLRDALEEFK